jgi:hypothetical protein
VHPLGVARDPGRDPRRALARVCGKRIGTRFSSPDDWV